MRKQDAKNMLAIVNNQTFMREIEVIAKNGAASFDDSLRKFVAKTFALQWPKDFTKIAAIVDIINHFVDINDSKVAVTINKPLDEKTIFILESRLARHFDPNANNEFVNVIMPDVAQDIEEWKSLPPAPEPGVKEEIAVRKVILKSIEATTGTVKSFIDNGDMAIAKRYLTANRLMITTFQTQFLKQLEIDKILNLVDTIVAEAGRPKPLISLTEANQIIGEALKKLTELRKSIDIGYDTANKGYRAKAVCSIIDRATAKIQVAEDIMSRQVKLERSPIKSYSKKSESTSEKMVEENLSRRSNEHK